MTYPTNHRLIAEQLTARVYRDTGDHQALATLAVAHALLATPPAAPAPDLPPAAARPITWQGWVVLVLLLGTVLGIVALVTQ